MILMVTIMTTMLRMRVYCIDDDDADDDDDVVMMGLLI